MADRTFIRFLLGVYYEHIRVGLPSHRVLSRGRSLTRTLMPLEMFILAEFAATDGTLNTACHCRHFAGSQQAKAKDLFPEFESWDLLRSVMWECTQLEDNIFRLVRWYWATCCQEGSYKYFRRHGEVVGRTSGGKVLLVG
jgi:hypothetical protein